jgi:hypothetical protein
MRTIVAALLLAFSITAYAGDVIEGLWEISLVMRVEGQDYGPYTRQECINKTEGQDPGKLFGAAGNECEFVNKRYFGNQFNFNVRCNAGIPLEGTGQVEFSPDRMHGSMMLNARVPEGPSVETASEISGKRLGACQKQAE